MEERTVNTTVQETAGTATDAQLAEAAPETVLPERAADPVGAAKTPSAGESWVTLETAPSSTRAAQAATISSAAGTDVSCCSIHRQREAHSGFSAATIPWAAPEGYMASS